MSEQPQWKPVSTFGRGVIYANGLDRKIVTPGMTDFEYKVKPIAQLIRALPVLLSVRDNVPQLQTSSIT